MLTSSIDFHSGLEARLIQGRDAGQEANELMDG